MPHVLLALLLAAASPPKLAMPEWSRVEVSPELGAFYADHFAVALRAKGIGVITSQEIGAVLGVERQKELLGCTESAASCMAELGNALGCEGVLKVSVAKLAGAVRANISVLSSLDGTVKAETSVAADDEKLFFVQLDEAAAVLADKLTPKAPMTPGKIRSLAWVPAALGGLGLVLGVVGRIVAQVEYDALGNANDAATAVATAQRGKAWYGFGAVAFVVAGLGAGTAVLMWLLGGPREVTPSVVVTPQGAHASVTLAF